MEGLWMYVGKCMDKVQVAWKVHMDGWKQSGSQDQRWKRIMNGRCMEEMYGSLAWMELAPSVECKWKRKSE